ncbi:hypothetical protein ACFV4P_35010 [Kitasatospora sp. NPDC059795]|uniref:hypothetical protein n=1 Tax=Kitasatospora sp. NPDC059795 TaxID=3346949 RepID=UPI00364A4C77
MNKARMLKALAATAMVSALTLGLAGPASADGSVTWKNGKTSWYLGSQPNGGGLTTMNYYWHWQDIQNSDGTWNEVDQFGHCLTGYGSQAYTETCNSGRDGTNAYQRWREINTGSGWKLQNVQSGGFLDESGNTGYGSVYVNSIDWNNQNQRWY